ncbi:hypothetical protein [Krasilnikovia cinnamomea]|uniref:hypothetical protein n=1 Tax=Krasilnikovia cinnamomea TaxID=349313 RepID=UPI00102D249F|nr:hypothetical protein [Krasilnikovia cinnamomea]
MINPETAPLDDTREDLAAANVEVLLAAARDRGKALGEPVRDPAADRDGWDVPAADGSVVRLLMPGVELTRLRDDITAQPPCLYLSGGAWWWPTPSGCWPARRAGAAAPAGSRTTRSAQT